MKPNLLAALAAVDVAKIKPQSRRLTGPVIGYAPAEVEVSSEPPTVLRPFRPDDRVLKSELAGVSNEAWTEFVFAMKVQALDMVSPSNGLGMFDLRFKRLADLGLVENLHYKRDIITNRSVQVADWVLPLTKEAFLKSASAQYRVFTTSMRAYYGEICSGKLRLISGMSPSGALAILHRGGRAALAKWGDPEEQFESTRELYRATKGVF